MHSTQITASSTYHQHQQPRAAAALARAAARSSLHKPQESPTPPGVHSYRQQLPPTSNTRPRRRRLALRHMGSYQHHAKGLNNVPYSAKSGYDLGYTAAYTSYALPTGPVRPRPTTNLVYSWHHGCQIGSSYGRWGVDKMFGAGLSPGLSHCLLLPASRPLPPKSSIGRGSPDIPQVVGPQVVAPGGLSSADVHASR